MEGNDSAIADAKEISIPSTLLLREKSPYFVLANNDADLVFLGFPLILFPTLGILPTCKTLMVEKFQLRFRSRRSLAKAVASTGLSSVFSSQSGINRIISSQSKSDVVPEKSVTIVAVAPVVVLFFALDTDEKHLPLSLLLCSESDNPKGISSSRLDSKSGTQEIVPLSNIGGGNRGVGKESTCCRSESKPLMKCPGFV